VAALPVVEATRIVVQRSQVVLDGDEALLELGARRAAHFDQLVGPYSRVGIHQPGPAVLYLLAPFVRILEPSGPGLYLGAVVIGGAALVATVAFLWRRLGPLAALWAAAAIDLYCLCLPVGTLREPWNPYLVAAPMVLFVVLWSAGITGSPGAGLWALVIGSYAVQTHIATAGVVAAMALILLARTAVGWRKPRPAGAGWGTARVTGTAALGLIWVAPVVELWRDQPNNLKVMWDFFTSPHSTPSFGQAVRVAGNALTNMPFGYHDYALALSRTDTELAIGAGLMVIGLVVAMAVGARRRQPMALALAAGAVLGAGLGIISLARTPGPVYLYFAVWLAYVPLSLVLAIGAALFGPAGANRSAHERTKTRPALAICLVVALAATAFTVRSDLRMAPVATSTGAGPWPVANDGSAQARARSIGDTAALAQAAQSVIHPGDRWVGFTVGTPSLWPYAAGIVLQLDRHGTQTTVSPASWDLYFGHERAPGRPVSVEFDLTSSTDPAPRGTVVGAVDGAVLSYQRTTG
jgi:hypothetical protein